MAVLTASRWGQVRVAGTLESWQLLEPEKGFFAGVVGAVDVLGKVPRLD